MPATLILVCPVSRTDEKVLLLLKIARGRVIEFLLAVGAVDQTGEDAALACRCPAVPLLPNLLHLLIDFLRDDCRVGVVENLLILYGVWPLLLVPD